MAGSDPAGQPHAIESAFGTALDRYLLQTKYMKSKSDKDQVTEKKLLELLQKVLPKATQRAQS